MDKGTARLICFGLGGHWVELEYDDPNTSGHLSGYDDPESFWKRLSPEDPADRYPDGCPVIDKRSVLEKRPALGIVCPMPKVGIDEPEHFAGHDSIVAQAMTKDPGNAYGTYLRIDKAHKEITREPGPLDYVPIAYYLEWWRKRGARVGVVHQGQFIWDD